jgi:asparagine synthetase B (glutamine-hydrolysing)
VDSTSIACVANSLIAQIGSAPVIAASATYPGLDCNEADYIDAAEKHVAIPVHRWNGTLADGVEYSQPLLAAPGNRMPWASGTEGYVDIARSYRAQIVLDGTGGDQLGMLLGAELDALSEGQWRRAAEYLFPSGLSWSQARRSLRSMLTDASPGWMRRAYHKLRPSPAPEWLTATIANRIVDEMPAIDTRSFSSHGQRLRWRKLTSASLAMTIDMKQRHASWSGLVLAFPFLDWDLAQFTLAVPAEYWPSPRPYARLHREALRSLLPPEIYIRQSKAEFTVAMVNRVRRGLGAISDLFEGPTWRAGEFVDQGRARALLRSFRRIATPDFSSVYAVWAIASLEAWLRGILRYRRAA